MCLLSKLRDYHERLKESEAVDDYKKRVFFRHKNSAVQDMCNGKPDKNNSMVVLVGK